MSKRWIITRKFPFEKKNIGTSIKKWGILYIKIGLLLG